MHKVLIVDDKAIIRRGLIKMIEWGRLGVELAGEARDAADALRCIETLHPTIVITDIRMHGEDGLTLLRQLSRSHPEIRTLVVSGYDDFAYTQQAIRSGSVDYLLKPVDPAELNRSITRACRLASGRAEGEEAELASLRIIRALRSQAVDETHLAFARETLGEGTEAAVLIARGRAAGIDTLDFSRELSRHWGGGAYHVAADGESTFVLVNALRAPADLWEKDIRRIAAHCLAKTGADGRRYMAGIGDIVGDADGLWRSYRGARSALSLCALNPSVSLASCRDVEECGRNETPPVDLGELKTALASGNGPAAQCALAALFAGLGGSTPLSPARLRAFTLRLVACIVDEEESAAAEAKQLMLRLEDDELMAGMGSLEAVADAWSPIIRDAALRCSERMNRAGAVPQRMRRFIRENFSSEISTKTIARLFCISPAHASTVFHKACGETISQCITRARIEEATRLLANGDWSIAEIGRRVGYEDLGYFHRVFKRITGETPGLYRSRLRG